MSLWIIDKPADEAWLGHSAVSHRQWDCVLGTDPAALEGKSNTYPSFGSGYSSQCRS